MSGSLTIITGPTASGKTTALGDLKAVLPNAYCIDEPAWNVRFSDILDMVVSGYNVIVTKITDTPLKVNVIHKGPK